MTRLSNKGRCLCAGGHSGGGFRGGRLSGGADEEDDDDDENVEVNVDVDVDVVVDVDVDESEDDYEDMGLTDGRAFKFDWSMDSWRICFVRLIHPTPTKVWPVPTSGP